MIKEIKIERFDNLANLREQLRKLEPATFGTETQDLRQARESLIAAMRSYMHSRYHLGRALRAYRAFFKPEHMWVEAAKIIAAFIGKSERSIYRIIDDFERADRLPPTTIEAMLEQNIDPAAHKHAEAVEQLLEMPEPETSEEAAVVVAAVKQRSAEKRTKPSSSKAEIGIEELANRTLKQLEPWYRSAPPKHRDEQLQYVLERVVNTLRSPIRELRQYSRPALVPKPVKQEVA